MSQHIAVCITSDIMNITFRSLPQVLCLAIVATGAAVHLYFLLQVFTVKSAAGLLFPLLVLTPWLVLLASIHLAQNRLRAAYNLFIAATVYLLFGAWAFWDTIYVHPDPQGGLIFLVIPVAASLVTLTLLLVLLLTKPKSAVSRGSQ